MSDNKRIAKNTGYLYIRMFIIMAVQLYASRVVLDKLGADDYGLYNVVGGVVGMLSFFTGTLSIATSRFITYELGTGNVQKLRTTFVTSFYTHLVLSAIVVFILETFGLWFFYNHLIIPADRIDTAFWVYQISILTTVVAIIQVPYSSVVMAHERMNIYAYLSIYEALGKLMVIYLLSIAPFDKMLVYAILIAIVQISLVIFYCLYCVKKFEECLLTFTFDKTVFRKLVGFSGLNMTANVAEMLKLQGVVVLINMFFQPAIVAAQAIGNQIASAMMVFINNIRTAVNPQIIKLYASEDYEASKKLTLKSSLYVYDLMLMLGLPFIYLMEPILNLWLKDVPPYTVIFSQYIVASQILGNFSAAFYTPMTAANKIKKNSVAAVIMGFGHFGILYLILKLNGSVMWVQYMTVANMALWSYLIKPYILYKDVNYNIPEMARYILLTLKVTIISVAISFPVRLLLNDSFINNIIIVVVTVLSVILGSWLFSDLEDRIRVKIYIHNRINLKKIKGDDRIS